MSRRGPRRSFADDFRQFFVRGLSVVLPTVLTLWLLVYAYRFVESSVAQPINAGVRALVLRAGPRVVGEAGMPEWWKVTPEQLEAARQQRARNLQQALPDDELLFETRVSRFREWWNARWWLRLTGVALAVVLIYLLGRLLGGFFGRSLYRRLDELLARAPVFNLVYPHVKQVVDFLFGENQRTAFKGVVLVEYPRKGIWTIGLATGSGAGAIEGVAGADCMTVFIPSSPTPFTGYTITVLKSETHPVPMTIDEALRFVISGGVLSPERVSADAAPRLTPGASGAPAP